MTLPRWRDAHSAAVMPINCKTRLSSAGLAPFPTDGVAFPAVAMALHPFALRARGGVPVAGRGMRAGRTRAARSRPMSLADLATKTTDRPGPLTRATAATKRRLCRGGIAANRAARRGGRVGGRPLAAPATGRLVGASGSALRSATEAHDESPAQAPMARRRQQRRTPARRRRQLRDGVAGGGGRRGRGSRLISAPSRRLAGSKSIGANARRRTIASPSSLDGEGLVRSSAARAMAKADRTSSPSPRSRRGSFAG